MSGFTTTPNYGLYKPTINADNDQWGNHLNANADTLDTTLVGLAPKASPVFTGDPRSVTPVLGDNDTSIATTAFVANTIAAAPPAGAVVADTPPTASPGTLWFDSVGGQLYVRYADATSTQWVPSAAIGLSNVATQTDVGKNTGRNLLHNPLFNVAQRGAGPFTVNGYTLDRWIASFLNGSLSTTQLTLADADRATIGDESAKYAMQAVCVGGAGAGDQTQLIQGVEDVRRLAGKTITVSFWAKATAGTPKLAIEFYQYFGAGGSPSATVFSIGMQAFTLSTTWTRYTSAPITIPSSTGKVLGSAGDYTALGFWLSSGATNNATRASSIGVQSYTLQMWGVQLEIGSVATPLEKPDPRYDLANCQRFYQVGWIGMTAAGQAGVANATIQRLTVMPRASPTCAIIGTPTYSNASAATIGPFGEPGTIQAAATVTAGSTASVFYFNFSASADL